MSSTPAPAAVGGAATRTATGPAGVRTRALLHRAPVEVLVFAVALASRLSVVFRSGGLHGSYGYDAPVYFAAADAFVHGRLPYRDFVLLHPPGLMLALSPFAALTQLVSDETAFTAANLAFAALGAVNAVLVVRICRALGFGRPAAVVGGLFYAPSFGAIGAEYLTKLEPLGNAFFLLAVLLALRAREPSAPRAGWAAGIALGVTVSIKIWWIVPVVAILLWDARTARRDQRVWAMTGGACLAALAINLPFFLAAPHAMFSGVITQQIGRRPSATARVLRMADLTSVPRLRGHLPTAAVGAGTILVVVVMAVAVVGAWQVHRARPVVLLLALQLIVLLAAPSFFAYYADYPTGAAAITVGAAAVRYSRPMVGRTPTRPMVGRAPTRLLRWAPVVSAAAVSALIVGTRAAVLRPLPGGASLTRSVAGVRCVMSDSQMALIELDALSRDLRAGCRDWSTSPAARTESTGLSARTRRGPGTRGGNAT